MPKINYLFYNRQILQLKSFLRYLNTIIGKTNIAKKLKELDFPEAFESIKPFLKKQDEQSISSFNKFLDDNYEIVIKSELKIGLETVKQNTLVTAYSVFESFLNHLVYVYCQYFPQIYKKRKMKIEPQAFDALNSTEQIQEYFIETFLKEFSFFPFKQKIKFIKSDLKLEDIDIWILEGDNIIFKINELRNDIVHKPKGIHLRHEQLLYYLRYLDAIMLKLSAFSQYKHGIEFEWIANTNDNIKIADKPNLR